MASDCIPITKLATWSVKLKGKTYSATHLYFSPSHKYAVHLLVYVTSSETPHNLSYKYVCLAAVSMVTADR